MVAPRAVTQHGGWRRAWSVVRGQEQAPSCRRHTEHLKIISRNDFRHVRFRSGRSSGPAQPEGLRLGLKSRELRELGRVVPQLFIQRIGKNGEVSLQSA